MIRGLAILGVLQAGCVVGIGPTFGTGRRGSVGFEVNAGAPYLQAAAGYRSGDGGTRYLRGDIAVDAIGVCGRGFRESAPTGRLGGGVALDRAGTTTGVFAASGGYARQLGDDTSRDRTFAAVVMFELGIRYVRGDIDLVFAPRFEIQKTTDQSGLATFPYSCDRT